MAAAHIDDLDFDGMHVDAPQTPAAASPEAPDAPVRLARRVVEEAVAAPPHVVRHLAFDDNEDDNEDGDVVMQQ
jgi:hypothetical protein